MHRTIINEFTSLRQAIDKKALVPVPCGRIDDAKKGEWKMAEGKEIVEGKVSNEKQDEAEEEMKKAKGKSIAVFQEKPKEKSKLLASSLAAAARSSVHVEQQIAEDVALAMTLQMEQALDLREKGVTVIPLIQPLQKLPSQAGPSSSSAALDLIAPSLTAPAATATTAEKSTPPPTVEKKRMMPSPPPNIMPKRAAPTEKEEDPKAKRQKIQKEITAKNTRLEEKKKEEEGRRKESERQEKLRLARIRKVEERTANLWEENRLIQSCLVRSAYIPFTPEESEVCAIQADIDACHVTIKSMIESGRYTTDEFDLIRKFINHRSPQFNSEMSEKFQRVMKELSGRSKEQIEERRAHHPDACEIEKFISDKLKDAWSECKEKFIKAYYFWQVVPHQEEVSKLDGLNNFMAMCYDPLRREIFTEAVLAEPKKKIIIVPEKKRFPMPLMPRSDVPDRSIIEAEVDEALELDNFHRESTETIKLMRAKVLDVYFSKKSSENQ